MLQTREEGGARFLFEFGSTVQVRVHEEFFVLKQFGAQLSFSEAFCGNVARTTDGVGGERGAANPTSSSRIVDALTARGS